ncbi:Dor1-like family-domain-containing protein [Russula vinacea]|nr:Dor1-like family-domain-containing protein [Russula vinacea]
MTDAGLPLAALGDILPSGHAKLLSSPKATSYLAQVTTLPLDSILAEPDNLSSTSSQLTNALTNLCTSSYPTFLSLHSTTTGLTSTLSSFSNTLDTLLEDIPALESAANSFTSRPRHSSKLQDILELPVLADACVRGGHFQEALDLTAHAARLATRFPQVQVVQDVHAEANGAIRALLGQLLATLRAPAKLPSLFRAVSFLRRIRVFPERELALAFLTGRLEALNVALTSAEGEKRGLDAPDAWVRYMKKYIDTLHTLRSLLPACTTQLLSRLLDALRLALPRFPDAPALTALLSQLTYCATSFARLGFDFRTLLPPLFEDAVRARVSGEFSRAVEEFARTTSGVLHMPPQALVVYPPIAMLANALLAALNGLRLLAPVALLSDLAKALDVSLSKAFDTLLEAPRDEARGAATAFLRLLVPFVRKGLIEGVYGSSVVNVPPSEALQEMIEKMRVWVSEAETKEAA